MFLILYYYASLLYPGGNQVNAESTGFDWFHHYWCDVLESNAMNGKLNPARSFGIMGMLFFAFGMLPFWYFYPFHNGWSALMKIIIRWTGMMAMLFAVLVFTKLHATMIILSSGFGGLAILGLIVSLLKERRTLLFSYGLFSLFLVASNNFMYFSRIGVFILPLVQKVSFLIVLFWIVLINIGMIASIRKNFELAEPGLRT